MKYPSFIILLLTSLTLWAQQAPINPTPWRIPATTSVPTDSLPKIQQYIQQLTDSSKAAYVNSQNTRSLKLALNALQTAKQYGIKEHRAMLNFRVGYLLEKIEAYEEAVVFRATQAAWNLKNNNPLHAYHCYSDIGKLYYQLKKFSTSQQYYLIALRLSSKLDDTDLKGHALNNVGLTYLRSDSITKAIPYFKEALQAFKLKKQYKNFNALMIGVCQGNLAECYLHDYATAKQLLDSYLTIAQQQQASENVAEAYVKRGTLAMEHHLWQPAFSDLLKASALLKSSAQPKLYLRCLKSMTNTLSHLNQPKMMQQYLSAYLQLNDSLYGASRIQQITASKALLQLDKIQYELDFHRMSLTAKKKEIHYLKQTKKDQKVKWFLSLGLLTTSVVVAILGYIKMRQNQRKDAAIQEMKKQLIKAELKNKQLENLELKKNLKTKHTELTNFAIEISENYHLLKKLNTELKSLKESGKSESPEYQSLVQLLDGQLGLDNQLKDFQRKANLLHKEYNNTLLSIHPSLTKNDLYLCSLIRLHLTNKDMAILRNVTEKAVRMSKYRLKQKLQLNKSADLHAYLNNL